ncbi:MAG: hypothetical protein KJS92_05580 [Bacteroidetes bacterium]|nr:hypothetical protein [Bacteroidota bacterium]
MRYILFITLAAGTMLPASAQVQTRNKEVGINGLNMLFSRQVELLIRKPLKQEGQMRRIELNGMPSYSNTPVYNQQQGFEKAPEQYQKEFDAYARIGIQVAKERYSQLGGNFALYRGTLWCLNLNYSASRDVVVSQNDATRYSNGRLSVAPGLGYLVGFKYQAGKHIALSLDNNITLNAALTRVNYESSTYNLQSGKDNPPYSSTYMNQSVNLSPGIISRLWITYCF